MRATPTTRGARVPQRIIGRGPSRPVVTRGRPAGTDQEATMWSEFRAFLLTTNALALAVGVIIGAAGGTVVASLVTDVIMPPVGWILGSVDFSSVVITLP